mgnify:CR=1 FL=1
MYKAMSFPLLLRGFVVLGVMLMHTTWYFSHAHAESWVTISEMLLDIISLFAYPGNVCFGIYVHQHIAMQIIISGPSSQDVPVGAFAVFAVSLLYLGGAWFFSNASFTLKQAAYLIATGSSAVHMAFFRAMFGFYAIYPLLLLYFNRCRLHHRLHRFIIQVILLQLFWKICNNISCSNQAVILR